MEGIVQQANARAEVEAAAAYEYAKRGVELKLEEVALWIDWQSIYQDDKEEKMKGVRSLIRYATM